MKETPTVRVRVVCCPECGSTKVGFCEDEDTNLKCKDCQTKWRDKVAKSATVKRDVE